MAKSNENSRAAYVDIIRVISALVIFLFHALWHMNCEYGIFTGFIRQGAVFMVAFFMVSGFVLFYSNSKKNLTEPDAIKAFYRKRLSSIYPAYIAICLLYLVLDRSMPLIKRIILLPMDVMMLQSTAEGSFDNLHHGGTWFVSCLFFCYIITPFLTELIKKTSIKQKIVFMIVLYGICAYMPLAAHLAGYGTLYSSVIYRGMQFIIGMIMAGIYLDKKQSPRHIVLIVGILWVALLGGVSVLDAIGGSFRDYDFFVIPVFGLLILCSSYMGVKGKAGSAITDSRIFKYANEICYEFFLGQFACFKITNKVAMMNRSIDNTLCKTLLALFICIGLAVLMHELITKPGQRMLRGALKK